MIFIGLGANLDSRDHGPPMATLTAALAALGTNNCKVLRRSSWYRSAPVPASSQPWFINCVAELQSDLAPDALLAYLHATEDRFGRVRSTPNAPRMIDLDLLVYDGRVLETGSGPIVPHPRMQERAFVLLPLRELSPDWVDPRNGRTVQELIDDLPADQDCRPADDD
ncbi:MAG: 2-amino-4-hydroxy-6-hydroxymethyldihydropteridine diphosphokinase [Proteobacteria bacterium]|nr:2-amino-4-hydroxy-6-hydroxymethyldihydropteridine diphosphokinase [Pseudomonadota bacterium]